MVSRSSTLKDTVIANGMCSGCGVCAASSDVFSIQLTDDGTFQATVQNQEPDGISSVCPFSDQSQNEDQIGEALFASTCEYKQGIGYFSDCYAGHVTLPEVRKAGSSGGMGTWILLELLEQGLVDGILHVGGCDNADGVPFKYAISRTKEQVQARSKSRYYPVEMSEVLKELRVLDGKFAVVGLPCFVKGIRLLSKHDKEIERRVAFTVALFCGHLKSSHFADFFAWQAGIMPGGLQAINFRTKLQERAASNYGISVRGEGVDHCRANSEYEGSSWGYGFFKYSACEFCDDVVGETADISVGDAWLPEYVNDSGGSNVVIVRNEAIRGIVDSAIGSGKLAFERVAPERVIESQDAGLRHRRDGLAYRLHLRDQQNLWRPKKRVEPSASHLNERQKRVFELRQEIASESHKAFVVATDRGDLSEFFRLMQPLLSAYDKLYRPSLMSRVKTKTFVELSRVKKWVARMASRSQVDG
ncbi:Coenzyme F420 hydrogenase/dehydrogenase, beta subunit C-terminal domain [Novipirellula caenicola]|uniref:Coenzyme F420-reducing hydrogenase subunit beta n=1 Tax=Novipirellula caenicola TaxID=1536901 RepID=A0ABP9W0D3_9BACT